MIVDAVRPLSPGRRAFFIASRVGIARPMAATDPGVHAALSVISGSMGSFLPAPT